MRHRVAILFALLACSGDRSGSAAGGEAGGTLVIAMPAEPRMLMPPLVGMTQEKQVVDQIFDVLAEIGPDLNTFGDAGFTPRLARTWEWSLDSLSIAFHLDPAARWHDGKAVTARDVRFSLQVYQDPAVHAQDARALAVVDSISIRDSLTAVAWFNRRSAEQFYAITYNLLVLPEHLLRDADRSNLARSDFARHPVGSGPFRFVRWDARSAIEVAADTNYHLGRPFLDRVIWTLGGDLTTALNALVVGEVDLLETLTPDAMARVASSDVVRAVEFSSMSYSYLGFNLWDAREPTRPHPLFSDRTVRLAVSMALDRAAMAGNVLDTLAWVASGPFTRAVAFGDTTLNRVPYDTVAADRMLDSAGWRDTNGDGIRDREGRALRFGLLIPATSALRRQYAELIQALLRPRGIQVDIESVDPLLFGPRLFGGEFDALINTWMIVPSPSAIDATWRSKPPTQRGLNLQAWSNKAFDAALDSAMNELDRTRAFGLYRNAYLSLLTDVPAVWLYEPRTFVAVNRRLRTAGEQADSWWRFLRLWSIPADERISRDLPPSAPPANSLDTKSMPDSK